ncbi:MAG: hypothetical protein GYB31_17675 [Bacteroidetes bacterium]|nr:hypothetical protein [Bacteroidota bacterium]
MPIKLKLLLPLLGFLFSLSLNGQSDIKEEPVITYNISYGPQLPAGDLANRFGWNSSIGMDVEYISSSNWIFGVGGYFMFGNNVKENTIEFLYSPDTLLYAETGEPAFIGLRERGFYAGAHIGKLIPIQSKRARTGLRLILGSGLLQHKIRVQEDATVFVGQIAGDYKKGYDRLTNGLAFNQQIGWQYMSRNNRINFFIALEATEAFTQNRRSWNIDQMAVDTESRLDMLFGLRINWILPVFEPGTGDSDYY